ncbi:isopenicillin N synthase-like dioxygenase [Pseudomonas sp. TE12234]
MIDLTPRLTARTLHARRKFFDLHVANKSQLAEQALQSIGGLYEVERQERDLSDKDRWRIGKEKGKRPPTHLA